MRPPVTFDLGTQRTTPEVSGYNDPKSVATPGFLRRLPRIFGIAITALTVPLNAIFLTANVFTYAQFFRQMSMPSWAAYIGGFALTVGFTLIELNPQVRSHKNGGHYSRSLFFAQVVFAIEIATMSGYWLLSQNFWTLGFIEAILRVVVVVGSAFGVSISWDLAAHYLSKENK